jgi:hypothetical protein
MMRRIILFAVVAMLPCTYASAGMIVFTTEASFTSQLQPGYYQEGFNYAPWLTIVDPAISTPQSFAGNGWAYQISSPSGLSGQPIPPPNGPGGAVANYQIGQSVTVTFTGTLPRAVGGIFFVTDLNGSSVDNGTVNISVANGGTYNYADLSNWDAFTGFISDSPITSMTMTAGNFATMDDFIVGNPVPVPAAVLLGLLGLSAAGVKLRKFV